MDDLRPLAGTQKQIDWADEIRPRKLRQWERELTEYLDQRGRTPEQRSERIDLFERVKKMTYAGWWIESRESHLDEVTPLRSPRDASRD